VQLPDDGPQNRPKRAVVNVMNMQYSCLLS